MNTFVYKEYTTLFNQIHETDYRDNSASGKIYKAYRKGIFEDADSPGGSIPIFQFQNFLKEYHPNVYRVMYVTSLKDLPLNINDDEVTLIVKWRLQIGK